MVPSNVRNEDLVELSFIERVLPQCGDVFVNEFYLVHEIFMFIITPWKKY